MIGGLGMPELLVIFLIVLLLFGAKKIPDIARGLGGGIKEFKKTLKGEEEKGEDTVKKKEIPEGSGEHKEEGANNK